MRARIDRQGVEPLLHGKRCRCWGSSSSSWLNVAVVLLAKPALVGSAVKIVEKIGSTQLEIPRILLLLILLLLVIMFGSCRCRRCCC